MKYIIIIALLISRIWSYELKKDLSYDKYKKTKLDIYLPKDFNKKTIIMVHGGAWMLGSKSSRAVVKNKMEYFTNKGYGFISIDYRLLPAVDIIQQVDDIAKAIKFSQRYLKENYQTKERDVIIIGHSAGAHLVSLLTVSKNSRTKYNLSPWRATIALDSAALNVLSIMNNKHRRLYDKVFTNDKQYWKYVSPYHYISKKYEDFLLVCSSKREGSCKETNEFSKRLNKFSSNSNIIEVNLTHREINKDLGLDNNYTRKVNAFIESSFKN